MHIGQMRWVLFLLFLSIWTVYLLFNPKTPLAEGLRAFEVVPDKEKRSSIHEVDGYAYLSENMTISDLRAKSFANAKRQALEMAETYIRSKTKVADGKLAYDLIWSDAQGAVTVLEQKDMGIEKNNRYHVWIRAEVRYALTSRPSNEPAAAAVMAENAPLTVKVWSDRKHYRQGKFMTLFIQGNRDFYARIVDVAPDGKIIQLLPNTYRTLSQFTGGQTYTIPGPGDRFKLRVRGPFGQEKVIVYASEQPISNISMEGAGAGLKSYRGTLNTLNRQMRTIEPVFVGNDPLNSEFYEGVWEIQTTP